MDLTYTFSITSPDHYPLQHTTSQISLWVSNELTSYGLTRTNSLELVKLDDYCRMPVPEGLWNKSPQDPIKNVLHHLQSTEVFSFTHHPFQLCLRLYQTHSFSAVKSSTVLPYTFSSFAFTTYLFMCQRVTP